MSLCFECLKYITCCGFICRLFSSVKDIKNGVEDIKEEVVKKIENITDYPKLYYLHKENDLYVDLKTNEIVHLTLFETNKIERTATVI
jgi:hypothetical protein